jgi:hypothetical protein
MAHCGLTAPIPRQPQRCSGQAGVNLLPFVNLSFSLFCRENTQWHQWLTAKKRVAADRMWRKARLSFQSASRSAWRERPRRRLPKNALGLDLDLVCAGARPRPHACALSPRHRRGESCSLLRFAWTRLIRHHDLRSRNLLIILWIPMPRLCRDSVGADIYLFVSHPFIRI